MRMFFCTFGIFLLMLTSVKVSAIPADGILRKITQPDGKQLSLCQFGDEYVHFMMTSDSLVVKEDDKGRFYYALWDNNGIYPSQLLAHDALERNETESNFVIQRKLNGYDEQLIQHIYEEHQTKMSAANVIRTSMSKQALGIPNSYVGAKKGLVILVEFANLKMRSTEANNDFLRMFNETGYIENNHVGSVHDYFYDQSYGVFDLTFDVVGPVTVSKNYGYYGSDSMNGHNDMNVREMIVEACQLADEYIDYKDYDWDQDGIVDQVFVIYAGYGQATGGPSNTIWPHESYLTSDIELDGVKILQYACSNELYMGSTMEQDKLMGIGTACHEFSHCLGLPDLYDTNHSGAYGMGYWDVMNSGSYNGPNGLGEIPCGYSAFERWFAGWLEFDELKSSQKIYLMPSLEKSPKAYKIVNDGNENEYYTLENRQPEKWFKYVGQYEGPHGMLITHIDYDFKAWTTNKVNPSPNRQRMTPVVADNSYGNAYNDIVGDLFPGIMNVKEVTNTSHIDYGGKLYNRNIDGSYNMNKSILNISEKGGFMSFDVIFIRELPTPIAYEAKDVTENSFNAVWSPCENADSYTLELDIIRKVKSFVMETIQINGIYEAEYLINDIEAVYCNYRVRANKGDLHTEWSNQIMVPLHDISGIRNMEVDTNTDSSVFSLSGIKQSILRKGSIYIVEGKKKFYR